MWDDFADEYEAHAEHGVYNALYDRPAVLGLLGDVAGKDVLDVGCGPGLYTQELVRRGARLVALDQGERMVELAKARVGSGAEVRVHDLNQPLDWLDGETFDLAVMALVIHHLDDRISVLREIHRVLRRGGSLVVSTHHPMDDWLRLGGRYFEVTAVEERWKEGRWAVRYWRMPLTQICDEFTEAGFLIERLLEPRPDSRLKEADPERHDKLDRSPGFIAFRLLKP